MKNEQNKESGAGEVSFPATSGKSAWQSDLDDAIAKRAQKALDGTDRAVIVRRPELSRAEKMALSNRLISMWDQFHAAKTTREIDAIYLEIKALQGPRYQMEVK